MSDDNRNLLVAKIKQDQEEYEKDKERLRLLMLDEKIKEYVRLIVKISNAQEILLQKKRSNMQEVLKNNCTHDIYVFVGFSELTENGYTNTHILGNYEHFICLECLQDIYIPRKEAYLFHDSHNIIYLNDLDVNNENLKLLQYIYIDCLMEGATTEEAFKRIRTTR